MKNSLIYRLFSLITLTAVVIVFSCASKTNSGDCEQFKNGKFIFHPQGQQGGFFFSINRQDSIQIETDKKTGYYSKLLVRWTDKCKYEVILLETTFPFPDSIQKMRKTIPLKTEIISTTSDFYVFKSHRDNYPAIMDTMWVAK